MSDLIWVGNILLPRWVFFSAVGLLLLLLIVALVLTTDE